MEKVVNGEKVLLSKTEETAVKDEWLENEKIHAKEKEDALTEKTGHLETLRGSGLNDDAIKILRPDLVSILEVEDGTA